MKIQRLIRLRTWTLIVLSVYLLLTLWFAYTLLTPAPAKPMWQAHRYTGSEVQSLDSQQVQTYLHSAVVSLDAFRHDKDEMLLIIIGATFGIVGFLGWSTFMIGQIKREVDHVAQYEDRLRAVR